MDVTTDEIEKFKQWKEIPDILRKRGQEQLFAPYRFIEFTHDTASDALPNDLENYPHAFVLACIMDRQVRAAERAWRIPHEVSKELGGFEFKRLLKLNLDSVKEVFTRKRLHRFNETMATNFCLAIQTIHEKYKDDASNIWKGNPSSATVVRRFLQFSGVGIKIATMAANILVRDFKIPMRDKLSIEISPDVNVKRVFIRAGLLAENATIEELVYYARELNPEYPGVLDLAAWEIGNQWCSKSSPACAQCSIDSRCLKIGV